MTEKGCDNCYYTYFDEKAYPCSLCIRGIERTDQWQPSKKTKADRKTEPQIEDKHAVCTGCDYYDLPNAFHPCASCVDFSKYKPKIEDEPQTERAETMSCQECKHWDMGYHCDVGWDCKYEPEDEPQTDCSWK